MLTPKTIDKNKSPKEIALKFTSKKLSRIKISTSEIIERSKNKNKHLSTCLERGIQSPTPKHFRIEKCYLKQTTLILLKYWLKLLQNLKNCTKISRLEWKVGEILNACYHLLNSFR